MKGKLFVRQDIYIHFRTWTSVLSPTCDSYSDRYEFELHQRLPLFS